MCERCGNPKPRHKQRYCQECSLLVHHERHMLQKRKTGSRAEYDQMLALWRDGTIARMLREADA